MKTKNKFVVDAIFVIVIALVASCAIIHILTGRSTEETTCEPTTQATTQATTAETTEYITEPTEEETVATEPVVTLYDVPLDEDLQIFIGEKAMEYGIDPAIIIAMAKKESNYRANAMGDGGNSYGLLQVQLKWHRKRMQKLGCTDLLDPYQNVTVAVDYLAEQIDRYGGSLEKGLTAYNRGHYAGKVTKYAKSVIAMAERLAVAA